MRVNRKLPLHESKHRCLLCMSGKQALTTMSGANPTRFSRVVPGPISHGGPRTRRGPLENRLDTKEAQIEA